MMLVGEAYGVEEEKVNKPFVGRAGEMLNTILHQAGIRRQDCIVTNVFMCRPANNDVTLFFTTLKEARARKTKNADGLTAYRDSLYLRERYMDEILRLRREIAKHKPKCIVALGATALWALTGYNRISYAVGHQTLDYYITGGRFVVMPTWHPAYVLRDRSRIKEAVTHLKLAKDIAYAHPKNDRTLWKKPGLEARR
jgi:DNA polymerase